MLNLIIQIESELSPLAERMGDLRRVRQIVEQHLDIALSPSSYTEEELMTSCTLLEFSREHEQYKQKKGRHCRPFLDG